MSLSPAPKSWAGTQFLGRYDFLMMIDADDNEAVARLSLEVGVKNRDAH